MTTTKLRAVLHSYQYVTFSVICLYFVEICMYHAEAYTVTVYLSVWLGWMCKLCCWLPQLWTSESPCRPGMLYIMCYWWMLYADWHIKSHVLEHFLDAQKTHILKSYWYNFIPWQVYILLLYTPVIVWIRGVYLFLAEITDKQFCRWLKYWILKK